MNNTNVRILLAMLLTLLVFAVSCSKQPTSLPPTPPLNTPPATAATPAPETTPLPALPTAPQPTALPATLPAATLLPATPAMPINAAALVNGQAIPLQDFENQVTPAVGYLKQQPGFDANSKEGQAAIAQTRRQVLSWMIDQVLIEQAAKNEGIALSDEQVEAEIARLIGNDAAKFDEWLKANGLTRDSFKAQLQRELLGAALQEHIVGTLPAIVEQVHARHILLASESEAMNVLLKLRAGEDFAALAKQYSQDKASSEMGGDLGFFPRGVMPIEIEAVAFGLAPGQISGIVKTDFGYHIVEVVEKDPARKVPDEMVAAWRQKTFQRWLDAQRSAAKIVYLIPLE